MAERFIRLKKWFSRSVLGQPADEDEYTTEPGWQFLMFL